MYKWLCLPAVIVLLSLTGPINCFAGWQPEGTNWKYGAEGFLAQNEFKEIDGLVYHFDETGIMDTGWQSIDESWYYFSSDGHMLTGEQLIDRRAYAFADDGRMVLDGIHRDGMEDDLLTDSFVKTHDNWQESLFALSLVNQKRTAAGVPPLILDFDLSLVATYRCAHMNKYNYFDHEYNGETVQRSDWTSYSKSEAALSEILYLLGDKSKPNNGIKNMKTTREFANEAHTAFLNSPVHYSTMLDPDRQSAGVGYFRNDYETRDYAAILFSN